MSIQELGSIGELVAGIATVATLIYLALQIRQNTLASKVNRQHVVQTEFSRMHEHVASDESLANLVSLCRNPSTGELSPAENERIQSYANATANTYASIELAYRGGQFSREVYETYCHDFVRNIAMYPALKPRYRDMCEQNLISDYGIFKPLFDKDTSSDA